MEDLKLYMILLGCKPTGRHIEQHDIFFAIGASLHSLINDMQAFWPDSGVLHIDAWREVQSVGDYTIKVRERNMTVPEALSEGKTLSEKKLFFFNLGGYKPEEFEEFHYKVLSIHMDKAAATQEVKETVFYKHILSSHIDDKYGVDVDDVYEVVDILPPGMKENYYLEILPSSPQQEDILQIGYIKLSSL